MDTSQDAKHKDFEGDVSSNMFCCLIGWFLKFFCVVDRVGSLSRQKINSLKCMLELWGLWWVIVARGGHYIVKLRTTCEQSLLPLYYML